MGEAKEFVGRIVGDKDLTEEGETQVEVAHEVRDEAEEAENDK